MSEIKELSKAEQFYQKHLERTKLYNKTHPEVIKKSVYKYREKIKADPEKYSKYLEKQRGYARAKKERKNTTENAVTTEPSN